ncbi:immunoglobulin domain-containing protein, partial [Haloferula sp.]|uniref:immunoglobulin domain-containing protein n=1 Tax=Haloferula sp. TaxID=2497595 RepID=UPI003C78E479
MLRVDSNGNLEYAHYWLRNGAVDDIAFESTGSFVLKGSFTQATTNSSIIDQKYVARFDANGALDQSYRPKFDISPTEIEATGDDGLLALGRFTTLNDEPVGTFLKLDSNGALVEEIEPELKLPGRIDAFAIADDDSAWMIGAIDEVGGSRVGSNQILRLDLNGQLVEGFTPLALEGYVDIRCLEPLAGGGALVGGRLAINGLVNLIKVNPDGSLDTSFAPNPDNRVERLLELQDGSILIAGIFNNVDGSPAEDFAKLDANGDIDPNFVNALNTLPYDFVQQDADSVIMVGTFSGRIARINLDGTKDTTFPGLSIYSAPTQTFIDINANGDLFVAGSGKVYRLNPEGALRGSYDIRNMGGSYVDPNTFLLIDDRIFSFDLDYNGSPLLTVGTAGSPFYSFSEIFDEQNPSGTVKFLDVDSSGRIHLAGDFLSVGGVATGSWARMQLVPPAIATQPISQNALPGGNVTLTVEVDSESPVTYQWYRNGSSTNSSGNRTDTLTLSNISTGALGEYTVVVSNIGGSVTSDVATVAFPPPNISDQTRFIEADDNGDATLSVTATGLGALTYQWFVGERGNTNEPFGDSSSDQSVNVTGVSNFWVRVSNAYGATDSQTMTVVPKTPPTFTQHPQSATVSYGRNAILSIDYEGSEPISVEWRKDGEVINGITGRSYSITNADHSDARSYEVYLSSAYGNAISNPAIITIDPAPSLGAPAGNREAVEGNEVTLQVQAFGEPPLSYKWYRNDVLLPDATGSALLLASVSLADAGTYRVEVSNPDGLVTDTFELMVNTPPVIEEITAVAYAPTGGTAQFGVSASGSSPYTYQWYRGLPGDTSNPVGNDGSIFVTGVLSADENYHVVVSNAYGSVTSEGLQAIVGAPPAILTTFTDLPMVIGEEFRLEAEITGDGNLSYSWFRNGTFADNDYTGSEAVLLIENVQDFHEGNYYFQASNEFGTAISEPFRLSAVLKPAVSQVPVNPSVPEGDDYTLSMVIEGTEPLSYQWYLNESEIDGATNPTLLLPSVTLSDEGEYSLTVTNDYGVAQSGSIAFSVEAPAAVALSPESVQILSGTSTTLAATTYGSPTLTNQWYEGSLGDTSSPVGIDSPVLTTPVLTESTSYWLRVSNEFGSDDSDLVNVTIVYPPEITSQVPSTEVLAGTEVVFDVGVTGTEPLTYSWKKDGSPFGAANSSSLDLGSVSEDDEGSYQLFVSNAYGEAESDPI